MLREHRWRASPHWADRRPTRAAVAHWWGCSAPNRLADQAGGYRRIAVALAMLPVPLVTMAVALLVNGRPAGGAAHLVAAAGCGWLAYDLLNDGSSLNRRARPHASAVGLLVGIGLLIGLAPVEPAVGFGPPILLVTGMAALVAGYSMLMTAERRHHPLLFVAGRWVVVAGAVLVGAMQLGQAILEFPAATAHAVGLGTVAALLLALGWYEARVLLRGVALLRALARR